MNITITKKANYVEIAQANPMRWMLLSENEDGSFKNETSWLKCKDFFNDVVYAKQTGKTFAIYGFDTGSMKVGKKDEPVFMLLDVMTEQFPHNMEVLNEWLESSQKLPPIHVENYEDKKYFIEIPTEYFQNTYRVSLLTLLIRLMNVAHEFKDSKEVLEYTKFVPEDQSKWVSVVTKGIFFKLPEEYSEYIWYAGKEYNSKKYAEAYNIPSVVHNNGVLGWLKHL